MCRNTVGPGRRGGGRRRPCPHARPGPRRRDRDDRRACLRILLLFAAASVAPGGAVTAQELEPRAYAASPVGLNFLVVAGSRSGGDVLVDPSLPLDDVEATVYSAAIGAGRTMDVLGRTTLVMAVLPYAWLDATGSVAEEARRVARAGLADPRFKVAVNLIGGRALTAREFASGAPRTIVGVSLAVLPPLGHYERSRLINVGANRWAFKPEIGLSQAFSRWTVEAYGGVALFTANDRFYPGALVRRQQPIAALQAHVSYTQRPRLWVAFDATWYSGGTTQVDGVAQADLQRNSRVGATLSVPVSRQQSVKISTSVGATTRIGANFRTIGGAWQIAWLD